MTINHIKAEQNLKRNYLNLQACVPLKYDVRFV